MGMLGFRHRHGGNSGGDRHMFGATVVAKDAAKLARVDEKRFNFMVGQNPFFATHVMKVLADRLRRMNKLQAASANS